MFHLYQSQLKKASYNGLQNYKNPLLRKKCIESFLIQKWNLNKNHAYVKCITNMSHIKTISGTSFNFKLVHHWNACVTGLLGNVMRNLISAPQLFLLIGSQNA